MVVPISGWCGWTRLAPNFGNNPLGALLRISSAASRQQPMAVLSSVALPVQPTATKAAQISAARIFGQSDWMQVETKFGTKHLAAAPLTKFATFSKPRMAVISWAGPLLQPLAAIRPALVSVAMTIGSFAWIQPAANFGNWRSAVQGPIIYTVSSQLATADIFSEATPYPGVQETRPRQTTAERTSGSSNCSRPRL